MTRLVAIVAAAIAAVALGVMAFVGFRGTDDQYAQCRGSAIAGGAAQVGGPFTLVDETGRTVTDADVITEPSLVYFGYTFCPDVCPLDNARNAETVEILEGRGKIVKPVFITVDPQRDTPEVLAEFTDVLHPRMVGLTGTEDQIRAASQAYRTYYKKQEADQADPDYYLIDHTTFTYLVFPGEGFIEFFRRDLAPDQMADQVQCFLDAR